MNSRITNSYGGYYKGGVWETPNKCSSSMTAVVAHLLFKEIIVLIVTKKKR